MQQVFLLIATIVPHAVLLPLFALLALGLVVLSIVYALKAFFASLRLLTGKESVLAPSKYFLYSILVFYALSIFVPIFVDNTLVNHYPTAETFAMQKQSPNWEGILEFHNKLPFVADLHSDALMWTHRGSLLENHDMGHVNVPRMIKGNQAFQVFATVTKVPVVQKMEGNENVTNIVELLAIVQRWPSYAWGSPFGKALFQAQELARYAEISNEQFTLVTNAKDFSTFLERREKNKNLTAGLLCIEGAHAFEGNMSNVDALYNAGVRMVGMAHFSDNEFGGSRHGSGKYGLTEFGRKALARMIELNMIIDAAHSSDELVKDVLDATEITKHPILVSHTGVRGTCPGPRNLDDDTLKRIAQRQGIVGMGLWKEAMCGKSIQDFVNSVKYAVSVVGEDAVALGSDWDGAVSTAATPSELSHLTFALLESGLTEVQVAKIMGGNVQAFFARVLK